MAIQSRQKYQKLATIWKGRLVDELNFHARVHAWFTGSFASMHLVSHHSGSTKLVSVVAATVETVLLKQKSVSQK